MRALHAVAGVAALAAGAAVIDMAPANARGVFSRHPSSSTAWRVTRHRLRFPAIEYWIGQDLRLTIESVATEQHPTDMGDETAGRELDTLGAMFAALRACWIPPEKDEARPGMQMSVRFAFKRSGEIIATPRVTYATSGIPTETREVYLQAIMASLDRCTPMHFSAGLAGAVVGRPIAIRFVDNRELP
jgi:hypothetical protein